ncbi:ATP synthase F1 subunit epsilon [uncultured Megamonas sp.]|uniref:ATP synthase F1 subunit epsilon n=1 Tax=uncultured Megamonas sp. TaxID=286140 RepID=UPI0025D234F2|nr:ATP synthase F1 subunit epsilon [uncultured Megamonas sp.]
MAKIKLEIISPNKVVYSADIDMLIVRSIAGDLGIMPKHAPLLAGLVPHAMRAMIDGTENLIAVSGGFIQVQSDKIIVLASAAELPIEIDINRAKKAYERAHKRLESFKQNPEEKSDIDTLRARAALERAKARLKATKTDIG